MPSSSGRSRPRPRRVVVTTSVAESSLTVPGVRAVVDAGLARQPRLDPARGLTALVTTRVSKASADQRSGRAGREGPGRAYRCWSETDHVHLAAHTPPRDRDRRPGRVRPGRGCLGCARRDRPGPARHPAGPALSAAQDLLRGLDAVDARGRITARGRRLAAVGHPPATGPRVARRRRAGRRRPRRRGGGPALRRLRSPAGVTTCPHAARAALGARPGGHRPLA